MLCYYNNNNDDNNNNNNKNNNNNMTIYKAYICQSHQGRLCTMYA